MTTKEIKFNENGTIQYEIGGDDIDETLKENLTNIDLNTPSGNEEYEKAVARSISAQEKIDQMKYSSTSADLSKIICAPIPGY